MNENLLSHELSLYIEDVEKIKDDIIDKIRNNSYQFEDGSTQLSNISTTWNQFSSDYSTDCQDCILLLSGSGVPIINRAIDSFAIQPSDNFLVNGEQTFFYSLKFYIRVLGYNTLIEVFPGYTLRGEYEIKFHISRFYRELLPRTTESSPIMRTCVFIDYGEARKNDLYFNRLKIQQ